MTSGSSRSRRNRNSQRLSMAAENYLMSIYRMGEQGDSITLTALADHLKTLPDDEGLGTSLPSVGGMIRRLTRENLVATNSKKEIELTNVGRRSAENVVRRHRLAERMVVDLLGADLHVAHVEAHRLEHAISPYLEDKISDILGTPETCPFGHPIPGNGYTASRRIKTLDTAREGETLMVVAVPEDDQGLLAYFVQKRMIPGTVIEVREAAPIRGVMTLAADEESMVFSYDVACKIKVEPAPTE